MTSGVGASNASATGHASGTGQAAGTGAALTQADLLAILNRQTEAGNALVVAGLVEDWLEKLLMAAARSLNRDDVERIFGRMGPLNNFAGKIEIAFMFELIDAEVHADLRRIKNIRNAFAHTTQFVYFETEHIAKLCQTLSNWKTGADKQTCFRERAIECINAIKAKIDRFMLVHALKEEPSVSFTDDNA